MDFDFPSYLSGLVSGITLVCTVIGWYARKMKTLTAKVHPVEHAPGYFHESRPPLPKCISRCRRARSVKSRLDY